MASEIVLRMAEAVTVPGGRTLIAYDGDGNRLPNVVKVTLDSEAGEHAMVTVTLRVDGKAVRFE